MRLTTSESPRRERRLVLSVRNGLTHIAIWQFAGFLILLLLVWVNELIDIAAFFLNEPAGNPDYLRAALASAAVLLGAVIVVGTTYLQQQAILAEVLTVCSYCHKIAIDKDVWKSIETHLDANPLLKLSHGICPDCIEKVRKTWEEEDPHARHSPPAH